MFLVNSRHPLFFAINNFIFKLLTSLLANLQEQFAEFLKINYTIMLRPTRVSFSTARFVE